MKEGSVYRVRSVLSDISSSQYLSDKHLGSPVSLLLDLARPDIDIETGESADSHISCVRSNNTGPVRAVSGPVRCKPGKPGQLQATIRSTAGWLCTGGDFLTKNIHSNLDTI